VKATLIAGIAGAIAVASFFVLFANGLILLPGNGTDDSRRRLVFTGFVDDGSSQLYVVNEDGSGLTNLTNDSLWKIKPRASPDGSKIAYLGYEGYPAGHGTNVGIFIINVNGGGKEKISESFNGIGNLVWSPDGKRIAFEEQRQISIVNVDGTGYRSLTSDERPVSNFGPVWMSDNRIAFEKVRYDENERRFPESSFYEIEVDTGNVSKLFDFDYNISGTHVWSPDRTKIVFKQGTLPNEDFSPTLLYIMDSQGHNPKRLTSAESGLPVLPVWAPDSNRIVFSRGQEFVQLEVDSGRISNLAESEPHDSVVDWSDDGSKIVFVRAEEDGYSICVMHSDGSNQKRIVDASYPNFGDSIDWLP
jgi:Tol biopolymer transport system component